MIDYVAAIWIVFLVLVGALFAAFAYSEGLSGDHPAEQPNLDPELMLYGFLVVVGYLLAAVIYTIIATV